MTNRRTLLGVAGCALLMAACSGSSTSASAPPLRFTAIPDADATELEAKFAPLAAHLSRELGVPVEYLPSDDYTASVEMFKNGDIQLAWFGGLTGVQARQAVDGSQAIAQGRTDELFKSYFIANASTGLERSDDFPTELAEFTFLFGSPSSTSGRLMPEYFILEATGKSAEKFFGTLPTFSGDHKQTALMVARGEADAGALNYVVYDDLVASGEIDPEVCRVIWETPAYVDYNWTVRPEVDTDWPGVSSAKLREVLLAIDDPELLAALRRPEGLIAAENSDYSSIEATAKALGLIR
ncbi:putative selenate ABC transporter substrate-binding protein [Engelhardtia mirabilis]